jgi:hypothetical protein
MAGLLTVGELVTPAPWAGWRSPRQNTRIIGRATAGILTADPCCLRYALEPALPSPLPGSGR